MAPAPSCPLPPVAGGGQLYLQYVDLTDCQALEDCGIKALARACPQLTHLFLRRCVRLTDVALKCVASYCVVLRELSISDCVQARGPSRGGSSAGVQLPRTGPLLPGACGDLASPAQCVGSAGVEPVDWSFKCSAL